MYMVEVTVPENTVSTIVNYIEYCILLDQSDMTVLLQTNGEGFQTLKLLSLLPTVRCASPRVVEQQEQLGNVISQTLVMTGLTLCPLSCSGAGILGMDVQEFRGSTIQRVYQYLRRHAANQNLDTFSYRHGCVEGSNRDFLRIILR